MAPNAMDVRAPPAAPRSLALRRLRQRNRLARIHDVVRVERKLDRTHQVDRLAMLLYENVELVPTYAMLAGASAAHRDRAHADALRQRFGARAFPGQFAVEQNNQMEVAVTDMAHDRCRQ